MLNLLALLTFVAADILGGPLSVGSIHAPNNCVFLGYQEDTGAVEYVCTIGMRLS